MKMLPLWTIKVGEGKDYHGLQVGYIPSVMSWVGLIGSPLPVTSKTYR